MNTPLKQALARGLAVAISAHLNEYFAKPRRELPTDEQLVDLMLPHLEAFTLDWRRVEDDMPDAETTAIVAIEDDPEIWLGYLGDGNRWMATDAMPIENRVVAWAPFPAVPEARQLIGFLPREKGTG